MPSQLDEPLQAPILVLEGRDVSLHLTLAEAIGGLEGVDVADGIYRVFDGAGRRIVLRAEGVSRGRFTVSVGTVHVDRIETSPEAVADLRLALVEHLTTAGGRSDSDLAEADLATLVEALRRT
jgi:hypothetical protein